MSWLGTSLCKFKGTVYFIRKPFGIQIRISGMVCNSPMQTNGDEVVMVNETELEEMKQCISGEFQLFFYI